MSTFEAFPPNAEIPQYYRLDTVVYSDTADSLSTMRVVGEGLAPIIRDVVAMHQFYTKCREDGELWVARTPDEKLEALAPPAVSAERDPTEALKTMQLNVHPSRKAYIEAQRDGEGPEDLADFWAAATGLYNTIQAQTSAGNELLIITGGLELYNLDFRSILSEDTTPKQVGRLRRIAFGIGGFMRKTD